MIFQTVVNFDRSSFPFVPTYLPCSHSCSYSFTIGIGGIIFWDHSKQNKTKNSMGVGEFLSSKANNEWILSEREREEWEMQNFREGEIQEMIDIYVNKGLTLEDATIVIKTMAKYEDFFVDIMMQQELELQVPESNHVEQSMKEGKFSNESNLELDFIRFLHFIKDD